PREPPSRLEPDDYWLVLRRVFEGVRQVIDQHLADAHAIGANRERRLCGQAQLDLTLGVRQALLLGKLAHERDEVAWCDVKFQPVRADARDIEEVVHQTTKSPHLAVGAGE